MVNLNQESISGIFPKLENLVSCWKLDIVCAAAVLMLVYLD